MTRTVAVALAALVLGLAPVALAQTAPASTSQNQVNTTSRTVGQSGEKTCIDNPRFNPDNDEDGPRASNPETVSSPYVSTPTARKPELACR
jgi:hypothetical protein